MEKFSTQNSENPKTNSRWDILTKYGEDERRRVDRLKSDMTNGIWDWASESPGMAESGSEAQARYEREKIDIPASTIRKLGRSALDLLGISFSGSETRRDREAMSIAVSEKQAEDAKVAEAEVQSILDNTTREIRASVEKIMNEEEKEKLDREKLESQFISESDRMKRQKTNYIRNERAQEIIERQLNSQLLTVDNLEEEVLAENPEVEKRSVEFEGEEIPVYDLKGIPFSMLSHAIDYRAADWHRPNHIGVQTSQNLLKNPSLWTETREQAEQDGGYGTRDGNARGNVISTSYVNSESNLNSRVYGRTNGHVHVCYGFSHLEGDSLLRISWGDGGTTNKTSDKVRTGINPYDLAHFRRFEGSESKTGYNEFLIRRYSETGKPRLPDYIIAQNGIISDDMMRHAKFFNIPIVNIDESSYKEKFEKRALDALESISEDSSYEDISSAIDVIKTTPLYNHEIHTFKSIGDGRAEEYFRQREHLLNAGQYDETHKKLMNLEKLELEKRPQFIINEIKKSTEECEKATAAGQKYEFSSESLSSLSVSVYDVGADARSDSSGNSGSKMHLNGSGACSEIRVNMVMKNSVRLVETQIRDGERRIGVYDKNQFKNQDSSTYDEMLPIVKTYLAALKANREVK